MKIVCDKCSSAHELQPPPWVVASGRAFRFRCSSCGHSQMVEASAPSAEPVRVDGPTLPPEDPADRTTELAGAVDTFHMNAFYDEAPPTAETEAQTDMLPPIQARPASSDAPKSLSSTILPLDEDDELDDASAIYLKQDGRVYMVEDWDTMRAWIEEGRVGREDLVSEGGVRWSPVGSHPKAARTFALLDQRAAMSDADFPIDDLPVEDTSEVHAAHNPFFDDEPSEVSASAVSPFDAPPAPSVARFPAASETAGVSTGLPALPDLGGGARPKASISDSTEDPLAGSQQLGDVDSIPPMSALPELGALPDLPELPAIPDIASPALAEDVGDPLTAPPALLDEDDLAEAETQGGGYASTSSLFSEPLPETSDDDEEPTGVPPLSGGMDPFGDPDATQPPPPRTPTPLPAPMQEVDAPDPVDTSILGPEPEGDTAPAPDVHSVDDDTGFGSDFFGSDSHELGLADEDHAATGSSRKWMLVGAAVVTAIALPLLLMKGLAVTEVPEPQTGPSLSAALGDPGSEPDTEAATEAPEPDTEAATEAPEPDTEAATEAPEPDTEAPAPVTPPPPKEVAPKPPPKEAAPAAVNPNKEADRCWSLADTNQGSAKAAAKKALAAKPGHGAANLCMAYVMVNYESNPPGAKPFLCRAAAAGGQDAAEANGMLGRVGLSCK